MEQTLKGTQLYWSGATDPQKPTVVLIHNMWGNHKILQRHCALFQSLGYPTATFNLFRGSSIKDKSTYPLSYYFNFLHASWASQIRDVLNSIKGPKIIFAMSGPSISAIIACDGRTDITHLICDGGPFREIWSCTFRLFTQVYPIPTWPLRCLVTTGGVLQWGWHAYYHSQRVLKHWKPATPIFSIRGQKDPLVFPQNIAGIFDHHKNLKLSVWEIPDGQHLDGLKNFTSDYEQKINRFLQD